MTLELREPPALGRRAIRTRLAGVAARGGRHVSQWMAAGRAGWWRLQARRKVESLAHPIKLCLGSGRAPIVGWVNVDMDRNADVRADVRFILPFPSASVSFIYSEHLVEHLILADHLHLLRECHRVLLPNGVIRIATPDLETVVADYRSDWRRADWVKWPEFGWIDSGVRMLNTAVRDWGHQYIYDYSELTMRMSQVGFGAFVRTQIGVSAHPELRGLETRVDSSLIVEARKNPL